MQGRLLFFLSQLSTFLVNVRFSSVQGSVFDQELVNQIYVNFKLKVFLKNVSRIERDYFNVGLKKNLNLTSHLSNDWKLTKLLSTFVISFFFRPSKCILLY